MPRLLAAAALVVTARLAGCDMLGGALGIESPEKVAATREAESKAIGAACRHAARAIEDCDTLNRKADKAAVFAGWRDMNDYMRENRIEPVAPVLAVQPSTPGVKASTGAAGRTNEGHGARRLTPRRLAPRSLRVVAPNAFRRTALDGRRPAGKVAPCPWAGAAIKPSLTPTSIATFTVVGVTAAAVPVTIDAQTPPAAAAAASAVRAPEERSASGFRAIVVRGSMTVVLGQGTREGVVLVADAAALKSVETRVVDHAGVPALQRGTARRW